jgi:hypothetical protein
VTKKGRKAVSEAISLRGRAFSSFSVVDVLVDVPFLSL